MGQVGPPSRRLGGQSVRVAGDAEADRRRRPRLLRDKGLCRRGLLEARLLRLLVRSHAGPLRLEGRGQERVDARSLGVERRRLLLLRELSVPCRLGLHGGELLGPGIGKGTLLLRRHLLRGHLTGHHGLHEGTVLLGHARLVLLEGLLAGEAGHLGRHLGILLLHLLHLLLLEHLLLLLHAHLVDLLEALALRRNPSLNSAGHLRREGRGGEAARLS